MLPFRRIEHASAQAKAKHDSFYADENIVNEVVSSISLAYLRYKRLILSKIKIGFVAILKCQDFKIHNHPEVGALIGLPNSFGMRWRFEGDAKKRRDLIIKEVIHRDDHEDIVSSFFGKLFSGKLDSQMSIDICAGCLEPRNRFTPWQTWYNDGTRSFCNACWPIYCEEATIPLAALDKYWLSIMPMWEHPDINLIQWAGEADSTRIQGEDLDGLAAELFWTTLPQIHEAQVQITKHWIRGNLDLLWYEGGNFGINDFLRSPTSLQTGLQQLSKLAVGSKVVKDLILTATDPLHEYGAHINGSKELRQDLIKLGWTTDDRDRIFHLLAAARRDRHLAFDYAFDRRLVDALWLAFISGAKVTEAWEQLKHTLADAVWREVLQMYNSAERKHWREYIDLVDDRTTLLSGTDFDDLSNYMLYEIFTYANHWEYIMNHFVEFNKIEQSDIEIALSAWLFQSAEDCWDSYLKDNNFRSRERDFLRNHIVLHRRQTNDRGQSVREPVIVERAKKWQLSERYYINAHLYEVYEIKDEVLKVGDPWRVGIEGNVAWFCKQEEVCHCQGHGVRKRKALNNKVAGEYWGHKHSWNSRAQELEGGTKALG